MMDNTLPSFIQGPVHLKLYSAFPACICITEFMQILKETRLRDKEATLSTVRMQFHSEQQHSIRSSHLLYSSRPPPKTWHWTTSHLPCFKWQPPVWDHKKDKVSRHDGHHHHLHRPQPSHTAWDGLGVTVVLDAWTEGGAEEQWETLKKSHKVQWISRQGSREQNSVCLSCPIQNQVKTLPLKNQIPKDV